MVWIIYKKQLISLFKIMAFIVNDIRYFQDVLNLIFALANMKLTNKNCYFTVQYPLFVPDWNLSH